MTRKEEIKQAANEYADDVPDIVQSIIAQVGFEMGADWADRTMIDKACEWLENNLDGYLVIEEDGNACYIHSNVYRDFMGAMKGGQGND